jgi:hypothetical protein
MQVQTVTITCKMLELIVTAAWARDEKELTTIIEVINAGELARREETSWEGEVDRQGGSFTDQEIIDANSGTWRKMNNKRFEEMTLEELEAREFVINDMLKEIGEKYESLSGLEYTDVNGELYNTKQMIGDRISSLYSALGTIYYEIGKRTDR